MEIVFQPVTFGIYTSLKSKKKTVRLSWRHFRFPDQACLPSGPPPQASASFLTRPSAPLP